MTKKLAVGIVVFLFVLFSFLPPNVAFAQGSSTFEGISHALGFLGSQVWQRVAKELDLLRSFISKFTPKNTGAGIVLQTPESPAVKTSKKSEANNKKIASQAKTTTKSSVEVTKTQNENSIQNANADKQQEEKQTIAKKEVTKQSEPATISCAVFTNTIPQQNAVIFNEVAWMGTLVSSGNEWMELKSLSSLPISMEGWQIVNKDEKIKIAFGNQHTILPGQFFLLERTDDSSVPYIVADMIYSNAIGNTKDELYLFDNNCVMRDKIIADPQWPAGDSAERRSMERGANLSWHTYAGVLQNGMYGTPKAENSNQNFNPSVAAGGSSGGSSTITQEKTQKTYPKILLSEVQIGGTSSQIEEFVELYNPTSSDIDLTDWYLQKKTKSATSFSTFVSSNSFSGKTIKALSYFLIGRKGSSFEATADIATESSLAEDNTLALKNPNQEIVDKVGWGASQDFEKQAAQNPPAGKSIGRIYKSGLYTDTDDNSKDFEIQTPSPKLQNISPAVVVNTPVYTSKDTTIPVVSFNALDSLQNNISFSLTFAGNDPDTDSAVSPSGIDGFYLQYSVTPSADGIFLQSWNQGTAGELALNASTSAVTVSAQDGVAYLFSLFAKDKAGNKSLSTSVSTAVNLSKTVVINEVAWAGTKASATDEWMELYNNTSSSVNMAGWKLKSADGSPSFTLTGTIGANEYYLLERTNDSTINDTAASQIYTGALGNDGENLGLYDAENNLVDALDASAGWFAGNNTTKQSMERIDAKKSGSEKTNWLNNNLIKRNGKDAGENFINGTPKQQNSVSVSST